MDYDSSEEEEQKSMDFDCSDEDKNDNEFSNEINVSDHEEKKESNHKQDN